MTLARAVTTQSGMIQVRSVTSPSDVLSRHLPSTAPRAVRIAATTIDNFVGHEMSTYAAALAYRGLFALFPFIIFLFALMNVLDAWKLFDVLLESAAIVVVALVLVALYRFAPSHRQPFRALLPGTVVAALAWTSASLILSGAVSRVCQFGVTYGSFSVLAAERDVRHRWDGQP